MKSILVVLATVLVLGGLAGGLMSVFAFDGTGQSDVQVQAPGALSVAELLRDPVYDTEVKVYGQVSLLVS